MRAVVRYVAGAACLLCLLMPASALAMETRGGGEVTIGDSERIADDLYVAGGDVLLRGSVAGDVSVIAGDVRIAGEVNGAVNAAGGRVEIDGSVGRSVRVVGGATAVTGEIDGDLLVIGGALRLFSGGSIGGDLIVAGGSVDVRGSVGGDIIGTAGRFALGGDVGGDVDMDTTRLTVSSMTEIAGDLRYRSPLASSLPDGAVIGGEVRHTTGNPFVGGEVTAEALLGPLRRLLWALIAGAIVVALLPRAAASVARAGRRVLPSLALGLMLIWLVPIAAIVMIASVVGLPVGLILLASWVAGLYLSQVFVGLMVGRLMLPRKWDDGGRGYNLLGMTLGVIILAAIRLLPVPFLPAAISIVVTLIGLGAVARAALGRGGNSHSMRLVG